MNSIAVVTAVTAHVDYMGLHQFADDVDYLFFGDRSCYPPQRRWELHELPHPEHKPRRRAKLPKVNPHAIPALADYEYVIWIDGSMTITDPLFPHRILDLLPPDRDLLLSPHFDGRDCGYGEATIVPDKYADEPLAEQCDAYRAEGFPEHFGLYEAGMQARRMNGPGLADLGQVWWDQNIRWSIQDQVSLPYSLWRTGYQPAVMPQSWRNYGWVHLSAHRYEAK